MSEERMNPNFNLESCLRNKVNEAKRYLEDKHKRQKDEPCEESSYAESFIYYFQNVETLLDLYQQEKEKNKKLKYKINQISNIIDMNPYTAYTLYGDILYDDQAIRDIIEDTHKFKGELF